MTSPLHPLLTHDRPRRCPHCCSDDVLTGYQTPDPHAGHVARLCGDCHTAWCEESLQRDKTSAIGAAS